jgi:hypothetical protein
VFLTQTNILDTYIFPLNALYENRILKATKRTSRDRAEKKRGMRARVHPSKAEMLSRSRNII